MLSVLTFDGVASIGRRNVLAAEKALQEAGIEVQSQATGGKIGRTVKLRISDGQLTVRSLGQAERALV